MDVDDEYARKHMASEGGVLFFDKKSAPRWFRRVTSGALLAAGVAMAGTAAATGTPEMLLLGVPMLGVGYVGQLAFRTLRTMVTKRFVHIQYGLLGPKIPVEDLLSADVVDYDWKRYGGFGIRRNLFDGSHAYNMMGDQGRAVKLVYRDKGKERVVLVSAEAPERLAAAIAQARSATHAAADGSLADVRVRLGMRDAPPDVDAADVVARQTAVTLDEQLPSDVRERLAAALREKP